MTESNSSPNYSLHEAVFYHLCHTCIQMIFSNNKFFLSSFFYLNYYSLIVEKDLFRDLAYPERRGEPCLMLYKKRSVFWVSVKFIFSFCIYGDLVFQWILLCNNRPVSCFPYLFLWAVSWLSCDLIRLLNSRICAW